MGYNAYGKINQDKNKKERDNEKEKLNRRGSNGFRLLFARSANGTAFRSNGGNGGRCFFGSGPSGPRHVFLGGSKGRRKEKSSSSYQTITQ